MVPRNRDLPDRPHATRKHPRFYCRRYQGHRFLDADAAHHRLPREWLAPRLSADRGARHAQPHDHGVLHSERPGASTHGHIWHERQTGDRPPRHQEQKYPRQEKRSVCHSRLRAGRAVRGREERGGHRAQHARRHAAVHGARGAGREAGRDQLRGVQDGRHVLAGPGAVGDVPALRHGRQGAARGAVRAALQRLRAARPQLRAHARRGGGGARAAAGARALAGPGGRAAARAGAAHGGVLARQPARAAHGPPRQEDARQVQRGDHHQAGVTPRRPVYMCTVPSCKYVL